MKNVIYSRGTWPRRFILLLSLQLLILLPPGIAQAKIYALDVPTDGVIGAPEVVNSTYADTLTDIGRRFDLGYEEMRLSNPGVDPWLPGEGTEVRLATQFIVPDAPRVGAVINIAEYRMYYYFTDADGDPRLATFPISIGKLDWVTPLGKTRIVSKVEKPTWTPPKSVREEYAADGRELAEKVPAGPDNPLGDYALRLGLPGYLIHGTNRPAGVGMRVTHGCIRLYPEDIEWLFPQIPIKETVRIVNQPYKFGWKGNQLFFEAHPPMEVAEGEIAKSMTQVMQAYVRATQDRVAEVDWDLIEQTFEDSRGMPVEVGRSLGVRKSETPEVAANVSM